MIEAGGHIHDIWDISSLTSIDIIYTPPPKKKKEEKGEEEACVLSESRPYLTIRINHHKQELSMSSLSGKSSSSNK